MQDIRPFLLALLIAVTTTAEANEINVTQASNNFANGLYQALSKNEGNVFFSPLGIHAVLSMLYQGAAESTKDALATHLQVSEPSFAAEGHNKIINDLNKVENVTLHMANKVYVKTGVNLLPEYGNVLKEKFQSEVEKINFEEAQKAADSINSWVNEKTKGKIPTLFEKGDFDKYTRLALVNAIYFKGDWKTVFDKKLTRTEPFFVNGDTNITYVQMMHMQSHGFNYKRDQDLNAQVLQLPFSDQGVTMTVVLPFDRNGISDLESKVQQNGVDRIFENLHWEDELEVSLPKFKIETKMDLKKPLTEMGLGIIFDDKCNLTNMIDGDEDLHVSKAIQKAYIEVNEEGAEAAAATGAVVSVTYSLHQYERFIADHPFLVILKQGHNILFYGKIVEPKSDDEKAPTPEEAYQNYLECVEKARAEGKKVYEECTY